MIGLSCLFIYDLHASLPYLLPRSHLPGLAIIKQSIVFKAAHIPPNAFVVGNLRSDVEIVENYFLSDNGFKKLLDECWHNRFDNWCLLQIHGK